MTVGLCALLEAEPPSLAKRVVTSRFELVDSAPESPRVLFESAGVSAVGLTASDLAKARRILDATTTDGAGAEVSGLNLVQIGFNGASCPCVVAGNPAPCNVVLMLWTETSFKGIPQDGGGVDVILDGNLLGTLPGLPAGALPGINGVNITGVAAGPHTFRIESGTNGTNDELSIEVLDAPPFEAPLDLTCSEGPVDGDGTCQLVAEFGNPAPNPTFFFADLDGVNLQGFPRGDLTRFTLDGVPAGEHCIGFQGLLDLGDGTGYLGCREEACCTLECAPQACNQPRNVLLCQSTYDPEGGTIQAFWDLGEPFYEGGVTVLLDEVPLGVLEGDATAAVLEGVPLGEHVVGVQGDCGEAGVSNVTEATTEVLAETPIPEPVVPETLVQSWEDVDGGTTTASWTPNGVFVFIDVYILVGADLFFVGTVAGNTTGITVTGTGPDDLIVLQFFGSIGGRCYGSALVSPQPANGDGGYVPGDCNADGAVNISDPQALLNFLFLGAARPACFDGCDGNGDAQVNISDANFELNFLFLGGPPPPGWGGAAPLCRPLAGGDCEQLDPNCADA